MYVYAKPALDAAGAGVLVILLAPLLALVAVVIKIDSNGPIFYRAPRVGRQGRPFTMLKFRTMIADAHLGPSSTPDDDPRITRVGRIIRRYKLDELPQLLNVLTGDMSFVGPRPQVQWAVDLYTSEEREVLRVRPGISDLASIHFANEAEILKGSTDPDRDYMMKIHPHKMRLALEYVRSQSMALDFKVVLLTAAAVFRRQTTR